MNRDGTNENVRASPSLNDRPHLLEWHSAHSLALSAACKSPRSTRILRLLAADLAIEALAARRQAANEGRSHRRDYSPPPRDA